MSTTSNNPLRVAKLLDRAGHPTTFDNEALIAVRKAYAHCSAAGTSLGAMMIVDSEVFFRVATIPVKSYLKQIADMEDAAEARDAKMAELEAANAALAAANAAKDIELADKDAHVTNLKKRLREQQHGRGQQQRDEVSVDQEASPASSTIEVELIDFDSGSDILEVKASMRPLRWTRRVKARFNAYVAAGMSKAKIARLLATEYCRVVTIRKVVEMMRARWVKDVNGYLWAS